MIEIRSCHSLVIGGGVAGLRAALALAEFGDVLVVNKGSPMEGSSGQAQGGVAVALQDREDIELHYQDTLKAGKGLCREAAVRVLVEEGPARIEELISWGARFDRTGDHFAFAKEAGHRKERILRAKGDSTGEEIMGTLLHKVSAIPPIRRLNNIFSMDLLIHEGRCVGALVLNESNGRRLGIFSRVTVLSSGGLGQLYLRTTNPTVATGDGMAMGARGGAWLEDMEFVQFHPTSLVLQGAPPFLLSEAMRGEGAILRNKDGVPFMKNYHEDAELAPRDVVALGIWQEMVEKGSPCVYLDVTHLDSSFIKDRFPKIYSTCLNYGLDITQKMIPVSPSMHFMMGGVKTDLDGATSLKGLFAAGEVACAGVHGANRLASNSLLEGLVFGQRSGESAGRASRGIALLPEKEMQPMMDSLQTKGEGNPSTGMRTLEMRRELQKQMWEGVGILRDRHSLEKVLSFIERAEVQLPQSYGTRDDLELKNLLLLGKMVATASLLREESVGAHFRQDSIERSGKPVSHLGLRWHGTDQNIEVRKEVDSA